MKNLICIFAHPDDESFGPSGTIAKLSQNNNVYLICVTKGNARGDTKLGTLRKNEILKASKILGIRKVFCLRFEDGSLNNNLYHDTAKQITEIVDKIKPETLMTFEPRGVSGHIDHVAVSLITTYIFEKKDFAKKIMYYCLDTNYRKQIKNYFIYVPPGYKKNEIDKVVDISKYWDKKISAIKCHQSQSDDIKTILEIINKLPKEEYFLVLSKEK